MKRLYAVFGALLLLAVLAVGVSAQSGSGGYLDVENNLRVWQTSVFRGDVYAQDDMTVTDQLVVSGDITLSDDMTVTDVLQTGFFVMQPATTIVLSFDSILTPTATYQPISSTEAIGTASIAIKPAGTLLRIANVGSQTITFTDTGTLKLSGNSALGALDVALLISDGTNWIQVGESDN